MAIKIQSFSILLDYSFFLPQSLCYAVAIRILLGLTATRLSKLIVKLSNPMNSVVTFLHFIFDIWTLFSLWVVYHGHSIGPEWLSFAIFFYALHALLTFLIQWFFFLVFWMFKILNLLRSLSLCNLYSNSFNLLGRSYLLLLVRMNLLMVETIDGLISYLVL